MITEVSTPEYLIDVASESVSTVEVEVNTVSVTIETPGLVGPQGATGPQGNPGANGSNGTNGTNGTNGYSVLSGSTAPSSGLGVNNDLYINTSNGYLYKKISGAWAYQYNITGPTGPTGPAGANGEGYPDYSYFRTNSEFVHGVDDWWHGLHITATAYREAALVSGRAYFMPIVFTKRVNIRRAAVRVHTGASCTMEILLYSSRSQLPKERIWASGALSGSSSGVVEAGVDTVVDPGEYFLAFTHSTLAAGFRLYCTSVAAMTTIIGHNQSIATAPYTHIYLEGNNPESVQNPVELPGADAGTGVCPAIWVLLREP